MKHLRLGMAGWGLPVVGILVLGHGIVLYRISSTLKWSVLLGMVLLLLLKHFGILGPIYALFKRRSRS
ncbi:MAG TPA: hypothetical protein VL156_18050 [Terriglobales bacterium]|jgi:hypothetical protein|nr:hypothetical protein [Terriglobales bacterium]